MLDCHNACMYVSIYNVCTLYIRPCTFVCVCMHICARAFTFVLWEWFHSFAYLVRVFIFSLFACVENNNSNRTQEKLAKAVVDVSLLYTLKI